MSSFALAVVGVSWALDVNTPRQFGTAMKAVFGERFRLESSKNVTVGFEYMNLSLSLSLSFSKCLSRLWSYLWVSLILSLSGILIYRLIGLWFVDYWMVCVEFGSWMGPCVFERESMGLMGYLTYCLLLQETLIDGVAVAFAFWDVYIIVYFI